MVDSIARSTTLPTATLDIALRGVVRTTHSEATADHLDHEAHDRLEMVHGGVTALGIAYDSEMMRGALAVFEGRLDDPETRIEMENNPAFRDGAARAERLFYSDHERFMSIATGVRNVGAQGADAVYAGRDSGPEFERRYEQELPFRHGVDTARGLREDDPARFEAERRQAAQLRDGIDRARAGVPIAG